MEADTAQITAISQYISIFFVLCGILLSIVLPIAVKTLQRAKLESNFEKPSIWKRIIESWEKYGGSKYLRVLLAASLVSIVIVFLLELKFYTARDAVLAGFAWESFLNKLTVKSDTL